MRGANRRDRTAAWTRPLRPARLAGVLLIGALAWPVAAAAGPWTRSGGELYVKTGENFFVADTYVDASGTVREGVDYLGASTFVYFQVGHDDVWDGEVVDPRVHVALNCASLGCPNLRTTAPFAYRPEQLDAQLDEMSRKFADNDVKGAGPDGISRIFDWFGPDFEAAYGSVEAFVDAHRDGGAGDVDLDTYLTYDWSLNIAE